MSVATVHGIEDTSASPVEISVAVSPLNDKTILCIDGYPPIGLSAKATYTLIADLVSAVKQNEEANKKLQ